MAELPAGSRGRACGQGVRGKAPPPEAEGILSFRSENEVQICPFCYPVNCSNILFERLLLHFCSKSFYLSLHCGKKSGGCVPKPESLGV